MNAEEFLKEKSDWFDKSPGGEKLYFESEAIRMMNEYANEALRIHAVSGRSELLLKEQSDWLMANTNLYVEIIVDFVEAFKQ